MKFLLLTLLGVPMNWLDIGCFWSFFKEMTVPNMSRLSTDILWAEAYSQQLPIEFHVVLKLHILFSWAKMTCHQPICKRMGYWCCSISVYSGGGDPDPGVLWHWWVAGTHCTHHLLHQVPWEWDRHRKKGHHLQTKFVLNNFSIGN